MRWLALALCLAAWPSGRASADDDASALGSPRSSTVPVAHAAPRPNEPSQFALDLNASTMLPLVVGATIGFEVPGHVVFRVGAGIVPSAYVDAINSVGMGWGAYGTEAAQLASTLLGDATFLEFGIAIRPAGTAGIELAVSYALLWTHRRVSPSTFGVTATDAGLDVTIDAVHGELAWQSEPIEHVYFRIALGWAQSFDHHVTLATGDTAAQSELRGCADALAVTVGRYAFGPTLGASLGVRF